MDEKRVPRKTGCGNLQVLWRTSDERKTQAQLGAEARAGGNRRRGRSDVDAFPLALGFPVNNKPDHIA